MLLYYITGRLQFSGSEAQRRARLLEKIAEAAHNGVDYIQLREKDLMARDLENLALAASQAIEQARKNFGSCTRLLINSRADVALAAGAAGVHLRSSDISPADVRAIWRAAHISGNDDPAIAVSCHSAAEVARAAEQQSSFAVFAPVFEKQGSDHATGTAALQKACSYKIPVLALGGVTLENAAECVAAGASGIAAIRLFQENEIGAVVSRLRS